MKASIGSYTPFIQEGWRLFKVEWGFFIIAILIFIIIETFDGLFGIDSPTGSIIVTILSGMASLLLTVGFFQAIINYIDTSTMRFETFFHAYKKPKKVVRYMLGYIIMSFVIYGSATAIAGLLIGTLYLTEPEIFTDVSLAVAAKTNIFESIKPILVQLVAIFTLVLSAIIYLSTRLRFTMYLIIDKDFGPVRATKNSLHITKGNFWYIFWFTMCLIALNLLGLIFFMIGLAITIPVSIIAYTLFYRSIVQKHAF